MEFVNCTTLVIEAGFKKQLCNDDLLNLFDNSFVYDENIVQKYKNLFNQNKCSFVIIFDINYKEEDKYIYNINVIMKNDKFSNLSEKKYDKIINSIADFTEKINK